MKPVFRSALLVIFTLVLASGFSPAKASENNADEKVAKVGNIVITQSDVARRVQTIMPMQMGFHGSVSEEKVAEIKSKALEELILRAYKVQYAIDEEIAIDSQSFEKQWQQRLDKNKEAVSRASAEQLSKARAYFYLDFLAKKAEQIAVLDNIHVTEDDIEKYYRDNKEKFFRPKLYTASHIFVRVHPSDSSEIKEKKKERAEKLFERAESGEDFYNLAYYESDDRSKYVGGSLGSFHAGQTVAEFDEAIQSMKVGDVVGPIKTLYGYHVIKLDDLAEERQLGFDEVAGTIRGTLEDNQKKALETAWIDSLKKKYPVEYYTE